MTAAAAAPLSARRLPNFDPRKAIFELDGPFRARWVTSSDFGLTRSESQFKKKRVTNPFFPQYRVVSAIRTVYGVS